MSAISELTSGQINNTMKFSPAGQVIKNSAAMSNICDKLNAIGIKTNNTDKYDENVEQSIMEFQYKNDLPVTGMIDEYTAQKLIDKSNEIMENNVKAQDDKEEYDEDADISYPHYEPFFKENSDKDARSSRKNITIKFGDGQIAKKIIDVYMRSIGTEIDTSGNPISETYEFIARDLKEIHVKDDKNKYIGIEEKLSSPADIKYNFDALKQL